MYNKTKMSNDSIEPSHQQPEQPAVEDENKNEDESSGIQEMKTEYQDDEGKTHCLEFDIVDGVTVEGKDGTYLLDFCRYKTIDGQAFEKPYVTIVHRTENSPALVFGFSLHECIGRLVYAVVARMIQQFGTNQTEIEMLNKMVKMIK